MASVELLREKRELVKYVVKVCDCTLAPPWPSAGKAVLSELLTCHANNRLQDYQKRGGRPVLPIGMTALEDWLLEAISVPALIVKLEQGGCHDGQHTKQLCSCAGGQVTLL